MSRAPRLAIALLMLAGCRSARTDEAPSPAASTASAHAANPAATLLIDDAHDGRHPDPTPFMIAPCASLVVDGIAHPFTVPNSFGATEPTSVHVIRGQSEYFRADWSPTKKTILSPDTLRPLNGDTPFGGFKAGDTYVVAVGSEQPSAPGEKLKFSPLWVTEVRVQ